MNWHCLITEAKFSSKYIEQTTLNCTKTIEKYDQRCRENNNTAELQVILISNNNYYIYMHIHISDGN